MGLFDDAIASLEAGEDLSSARMIGAMETIMSGAVGDDTIERFLLALRRKKETVEEVVAAAQTMRKFAVKLSRAYPDFLDTCGTGGDGLGTINASTLAAIAAASAGVKIAKHGNRSSAGVCGSADLLEALGVKIDLAPSGIESMMERSGFGFLFAPAFHPAMRYAMPARRRIKGKTIFNILGPLSNPAGAGRQLLGVYEERLLALVAEALIRLGAERALVVHAACGMDEISVTGLTNAAEVKNGSVRLFTLSPEEFGIKTAAPETIRADSLERSVEIAHTVLRGESSPATDLVCMNAGAALYVAGKAPSIGEGIKTARAFLAGGMALRKLGEIRDL